MELLTLSSEDEKLIQQAAQLLVDAFREHWPDAWPTLEEGLKEVHEMLEKARICRVAVDESGSLLGITGAISGYDGLVWELHPLAIQPSMQGRGTDQRQRIHLSSAAQSLCPTQRIVCETADKDPRLCADHVWKEST